jgi:two-component system, NtrC family, sensor kinase
MPPSVSSRSASGEAGGFSDSQIALLQTFAEQAVIAITSAETYRALQTRTSDLQETLEYQTATSDVLKVISRSTFDLQPVLDTLVETAARLCEADVANLVRREGELYRAVADFGYSPEYAAWLRAVGPYRPEGRSVGSRAALERGVVHVHDVAADPNYPSGPIALGKQRTSLGVPLLREGETIGMIVLARQRVEPFTDRQIELVSTFADQAVIAIENTRLITEQREALEQQTATAEVLRVINASPDNLAPVFEAILDKAHSLCGIAAGSLFTYDGMNFRAVATRGLSEEQSALFRRPFPPNIYLQQLIDGERLIHFPDVKSMSVIPDGEVARRTITSTDFRTMLAVPLRKDGALTGSISGLRLQVRPFSESEIGLLENFAAQAVIAMENARLLNEQREALEQQTATAEVLQVINASPGNLAPVFDALLEKAIRLCSSAFGTLWTYDGQIMRPVATRGLTPEQEVLLVDRHPAAGQPADGS